MEDPPENPSFAPGLSGPAVSARTAAIFHRFIGPDNFGAGATLVAENWIKIRTQLPDDPAVMAIAHLLGIEEDAVVGKLIRLWGWADEQLSDGHGDSVTRAGVDALVRAPGFAKALEKVRWLVVEETGIRIPRWEIHFSQTAKQRALTARRKQKQRSRFRHANVPGHRDQSRTEEEEERLARAGAPARPREGAPEAKSDNAEEKAAAQEGAAPAAARGEAGAFQRLLDSRRADAARKRGARLPKALDSAVTAVVDGGTRKKKQHGRIPEAKQAQTRKLLHDLVHSGDLTVADAADLATVAPPAIFRRALQRLTGEQGIRNVGGWLREAVTTWMVGTATFTQETDDGTTEEQATDG